MGFVRDLFYGPEVDPVAVSNRIAREIEETKKRYLWNRYNESEGSLVSSLVDQTDGKIIGEVNLGNGKSYISTYNGRVLGSYSSSEFAEKAIMEIIYFHVKNSVNRDEYGIVEY